ncbi:uncharacterized protein ARMOST_16957 [Armillaria ostoyae]|uniref:Uncharacterized protein n=1 Tax=Armillaria ostoyae TaxID=47428 RepID=A0A284RXN4_ARMOS|nr:uncharacterized protein ARMOST_16957 [Armillaria ostoyae]
MVVPHFGDYIAFRLDPVASLKYLNNTEVTKACEALKSTVYVACVTHLLCFPLPGVEYISIVLYSQTWLFRFCRPIPIRFYDRHCYHPTLTATHCHVRNDLTIGDPWFDPKYQLKHEERLLEIYHFQDVARRDTIRNEQKALLAGDAAGDVEDARPDERQASTVTLPLPSEHDAESQYDGSVHKTIEASGAPSIVSKRPSKLSTFLRSVLGKVLRRIPCLHSDLENYDRDLSDDPLQGFNLFGATPPDTMPVIEVIEDIESVKQINDPWNFFRELDALKRQASPDYHERIKVKVQADIDRAREKDEALYAQLQSKMPKREREPSPAETIAMSVTEDAKSGTNI